MLNHSSGLRSRTNRDDAGPSGSGSIGRLEKADADNSQEPKYIGSVSIANGQGSKHKYAMGVADRAFR